MSLSYDKPQDKRLTRFSTTARELPCRLRQISRLPRPLDQLPQHVFPRHDQRPVHTHHQSSLLPSSPTIHNLPEHQTPRPTYPLPNRAPHLSRLPRTHGRIHRSPHHPLSTRFPLLLPPEMAWKRLPRMSLHPKIFSSLTLPPVHSRGLLDRTPSQRMQYLSLRSEPLDMPHLRQRRLRALRCRARLQPLHGEQPRLLDGHADAAGLGLCQ